MKALSIDYGTRRIGVALGVDSLLVFSRTITVGSPHDAQEKLLDLVKREFVETIVVGLPLRLDGTEKSEAAHARSFALGISRQTGRPVVFIDERLTSVEAADILRKEGLAEPEIRQRVDAKTAELLLEQYWREQSSRP